MANDVINIDPNTLQTSQTSFDGTVQDLKGSGPLQPGQQYAPGYDSAGLPFMQAFQNSNPSHIADICSQIQAWIECRLWFGT